MLGSNGKHVFDLIGNTPLVEVEGVFAKLETTNPTGSIKDRMAYYMIKKAEERGELRKGMEIVEVTSGNTGISLAMISSVKGYRFTAVMPRSSSIERRKLIRLYGAKIILTPAEKGMKGAMERYREIIKRKRDAWYPRQFENPDNIEAHRKGIGREMISQMGEKIDAFVAGIGTGGTLIGVAKALEDVGLDAKIIGVEPAESPLLTKGEVGRHEIEGIGEGFIPKLVQDNLDMIDEIITVKSRDAVEMAKSIARKYGFLVGISSGANVLAAITLRKRYDRVVTVLPDRGERYLSIIRTVGKRRV